MIKKGKIFLLAVVLLLAFAQVASARLVTLGPVLPDTDPGPGWSAGYNGFPTWYRDSLGQTVMLSVPPNAVSIPDAVIPTNPFSVQIGFGTEAMYWHSTATLTVPGGQALVGMFLESSFGGGVAADKDQITFARIRIRIDAAVAGDYTVTHPYGTETFTVLPADVGVKAINVTRDVGVAVGIFTGALSGPIGPLLKQVGAPAGTMGDAVTPAPVVNGPNGNIVQIVGPGVNAQTNLFVTGGQLFTGTPFTIIRSTYTNNGNGTYAEVWATVPAPVTPGVAMTATVAGSPPVALSQVGQVFFGAIPITGPLSKALTVTATTNGVNPTTLNATLLDNVVLIPPTYSLGTKTLSIVAASTDGTATLRGFGWEGATAAGQPVNRNSAKTVFLNVPIAPIGVTIKSSAGGAIYERTIIIP